MKKITLSFVRTWDSLPNVSNEIRWSMDLRWQDARKPPSFHGLKDHVVFRTSENPNHVIDWATFEAVDRTEVQLKAVEDLRVRDNNLPSLLWWFNNDKIDLHLFHFFRRTNPRKDSILSSQAHGWSYGKLPTQTDTLFFKDRNNM